jgi:hypothetical protein
MGDGKIFVSAIEGVVRVRTRENGPEALAGEPDVLPLPKRPRLVDAEAS